MTDRKEFEEYLNSTAPKDSPQGVNYAERLRRFDRQKYNMLFYEWQHWQETQSRKDKQCAMNF